MSGMNKQKINGQKMPNLPENSKNTLLKVNLTCDIFTRLENRAKGTKNSIFVQSCFNLVNSPLPKESEQVRKITPISLTQ